MNACDAAVERLAQALLARGWRVATAESCTGGMIAAAMTARAGSSAWFERGFVTYSDAAKREMLDVAAATLERYGAVSEQTAREMASGALARSAANVAVAVTGIAGPSGGSAEKPVGTVCFAWAARDGRLRATTCRFAGDREAVREASVEVALKGLLDSVTSS